MICMNALVFFFELYQKIKNWNGLKISCQNKQKKKNKKKNEKKEKKKSGSENKNSQNEFLKKTISKNNPKKLPLLLKNKHSYELPSSTHVTKCCIGKMTKQKYWNSY